MGRGQDDLRRGAQSVLNRLLASLCAMALVLSFFSTVTVDSASARGEERALKLLNVHTNERAVIVFKRNGRYDQAGLREINHILRDWRRDEPTKMDPQLLDLLWTAYQATGSNEYINVICGYRAPATNGMLRNKSSGVAKNSLHMQGKAIDFFIPGVPLAKLRAIGLQIAYGGVGYYPKSGSPFVHMDTGSARHWPRMSRDALVAVFPQGGTIHVPSDGKPLPGYDRAMADYKARKSGGEFAVAANFPGARGGGLGSLFAAAKPEPAPAPVAAEPVQVAYADDELEDLIDTAAEEPAKRTVAVAAYAMEPQPLPRFAPRYTPVTAPAPVLAALPVPAPQPAAPAPAPLAIADAIPAVIRSAPVDFGAPDYWAAPSVPVALAEMMASRDQTRRGASLPIAPTAVVATATIDLTRPARANAITTAVLRSVDEPAPSAPRVMAYAPTFEPAPFIAQPPRPAVAEGEMPMPVFNPRIQAERAMIAAKAMAPEPVMTASIDRRAAVMPLPAAPAPGLTMTALDTAGLRLWISGANTRQMAYALLTMPDFTASPDLMVKPSVTLGGGFGEVAYRDLRTDRFSGSAVAQPELVDLRGARFLASVR